MNRFVTVLFFLLCFMGVCRADFSIVGPLSDDRTILPGNKYEGIILMRNTADAPQRVTVTQTDYIHKSDGTNIYGIAGSNKRSNARWMSLPAKSLIIPPKSDISFGYTVKVPKNKDMKGTYWSLIVLTPQYDLPASNLTGEAFGVTTVWQYGYQVSSSISDHKF